LSFRSREEYEEALRKQNKIMLGKTKTRVKSHPRKGTKGVKSHLRTISRKTTRTVPTTVDDTIVELVAKLYGDLEGFIKARDSSRDPEEREMLDDMIQAWQSQIASYPEHIQKRAKALRKI